MRQKSYVKLIQDLQKLDQEQCAAHNFQLSANARRNSPCLNSSRCRFLQRTWSFNRGRRCEVIQINMGSMSIEHCFIFSDHYHHDVPWSCLVFCIQELPRWFSVPSWGFFGHLSHLISKLRTASWLPSGASIGRERWAGRSRWPGTGKKQGDICWYYRT